ncbi:glucose 1-dehydrogenase [Nitrosospira multiformis]|uniref:Glucose 1-dehydrogenase n=1 Tax=Nitrosospira multiformis TaxID=1231 RepID=A0A1H8EEG7_9PROT|nr:glucose 1-dehydrogenase [Nitrosospira multiformis]
MNTKQRAISKDTFGLSGQIALLTGASSGIGRSCALALRRVGVKVVINHLPEASNEAAEVCREIEDVGGDAADVSDEDQVAAMFAETVARFGTLHILVNNAGIESSAKFQEMTLSQWQKVIDVNLTGMFLCSREAIREFLRRAQPDVSPASGKIICMSSVHQEIPWAFG